MRNTILAILMLVVSSNSIQILTDQVAQAIFQNEESYIIYVCQQCHASDRQIIGKYCHDKKCTMINVTHGDIKRQVQMYQRLVQFIGMKDTQFLLLLDLKNRLKYTLSLQQDDVSAQKIALFQNEYSKGTLNPHYTSQEALNHDSQENMRKIVGLNFMQFINGSQKLKILYLYINNDICDSCINIYKKISQISRQYQGNKNIAFGYFDLVKNQHKDLKQESVPLILIYEKGKPLYSRLTKEQLDKLESIIQQKLSISFPEQL